MIQKNQFTDQIVADLDPSKIRNNQWVFPTLNFRIFNKDGKGYIASVVNGNEEIFDLREDFVIVGACEYNGIAFITSYNLYTEEGEIGSYPSVTSGSFVREYEALQNFTDGDFRTSEFNFDLEHFVDMQAKPSFDNSIDIYLCDHKNPNRVINSGFKLDGTLNDRTYSINSFEGSIDQQPYTIRDLTHNPGSTEVAIGGTLQPGNFYIFARYMTSDYGRTPFVKSFGPFCVGGGSTAVTTRGKQDQDWINGTFNKTDKKINLQLINIDQNYAFLEFGILRYSAIEENGPAIPNVYLINNRYSITSDSMYVSIYGNESEALLTLEELITSVNDYTICKSQTSVYDRWLGANWKKAEQTYDREMLAEFAKNIEIGEFEDSTSFPNDPLGAEDYGTTTVQQQYQDVDKSKEKLGYFRDQIYPFVCVFVFSNGSESEAYPMEGNVGASGATKGLYKFQGWDQRDKTQKIILGVTFNTDYAVGYYNGLSVEEKQAGFGSVIGYYFARGERIENLICQGLIIRGYHSIKVQGPTHGGTHSFQSMKSTEWGPNNNDSPEDAAILPLIRGIYPLQRRESDTTPMAYGTSKSNGNGHDSQTALPPYLYDYTTLPSNDQFSGVEVYSGINAAHSNKYGIFSPDILLNDDIVVPEECYVNPIMRFSAFEGSSWPHYSLGNDDMYLLDDDHLPEEYVLDLNEEKATFLVNDYSLYQKVHTAVTNKFQTKGNLNFGSYMATGSGIRVGDDYFKNRNIGLCKYIGVYDLSNDNLKETCTILNENGEALSIVNLYREINDSTFETSTLNSFNVPTTAYHRIYDLIPLSGTYSSA
nr:hypothetical protein [bacterium]